MGEVDEADEVVVADACARSRPSTRRRIRRARGAATRRRPNRSPGHRRRHDRRGRTRRRLRRASAPSAVGMDEHLRQRRLVRQCQCTRGPSLRDLPAVHDRDRWSRCDRRAGDRRPSQPRSRTPPGVEVGVVLHHPRRDVRAVGEVHGDHARRARTNSAPRSRGRSSVPASATSGST